MLTLTMAGAAPAAHYEPCLHLLWQVLRLLLTVNAIALRPSLNKHNQPPLVYLARLLGSKAGYAARVVGNPSPNPN